MLETFNCFIKIQNPSITYSFHISNQIKVYHATENAYATEIQLTTQFQFAPRQVDNECTFQVQQWSDVNKSHYMFKWDALDRFTT